MTHRSHSGNKKVAVAVSPSHTSTKHRWRILVAAMFFLVWFLVAQQAWAQSDTEAEISEEEAAAQAEENADKKFDFFGDSHPKSVEQLREMEKHFAKLAAEVAGATVNIRVGQSQGTGVIVSRDGYIMTAAHVIGGAGRQATILLPDKTVLTATTLGLNRTVDSGLLKITDEDGEKYPYLNLGVSDDLKLGQWVMAIGHPGGWDEERGLVYRVGRILIKNDTSMSTDCSLVGGDSGGPLVDMEGNLIGIHSRIGGRLTDNIHVPVDLYSEQWDDLTNSRDWGRGIGGTNPANEPWMGLSFGGTRTEINRVNENGPADKAGIEVGDVLIEVDGRRTTSRNAFSRAFQQYNPGDEIKVKVRRDGEVLELDLTFGSQADRRRNR